LDVIKRELERDGSQQIIVLAHNKSLLKYLHDAIEHRNIATVGYYVGGMKEADLKRSELRKVIIATYAMAAEALDIKSLTTLLLATPKTDVVQAVGRILRQKGHQPVVLDIIDSHEPFRNQWRKRQAFYRKEEYEIHTTDSARYLKGEWDKQVAVRQRKANKGGVGQATITVDTSQDEQPKRKCLIKLKSAIPKT
jgi:hypothetical protein